MTKRSSRGFPVGTKVRSHYRACWTGMVAASGCDHHHGWVTRTNEKVEPLYGPHGPQHRDGHTPLHHLPHPNCVLVRVTHDGTGRALRKVQYKVLDCAWLTEVA